MLAARLADRNLAGKRSGIGMPPPHALAYIRAAVAHASGDFAGALAALVEGDRASPRLAGTLHWRNGRTAPFTNIVDSDDLTGPILPVMDGDAVLDIAYSELASVSFGDPRMSFDSLWMPAEIHPRAGRPFQAKVPAMYPNSGVSHEPHVRMGNETVWGRSTGYAVAVGQRDFKMFDGAGSMSMTGIMQIRAIAFTTSPASTR
jgi:protein involved in temperature-dependent protein secretion